MSILPSRSVCFRESSSGFVGSWLPFCRYNSKRPQRFGPIWLYTLGVLCSCAPVLGVQHFSMCFHWSFTCQRGDHGQRPGNMLRFRYVHSRELHTLVKIDISIQEGISQLSIVFLIVLCCSSVAPAPETNPLSAWRCERCLSSSSADW
jgi:hypothetical protein